MKSIKIAESTVSEGLAQIDGLKGLAPKEVNCLRLLAEEMFSVCKELLNVSTVDFEVKCTGRQYTLHVYTETLINEEMREQVLSVSSSGRNAANKGLKGMLGAIFEGLILPNQSVTISDTPWSYGMQFYGTSGIPLWTLSQYMAAAPQEQIQKEWDEMEKSIIANFSDDVSVGVRNDKLEITVTKTF